MSFFDRLFNFRQSDTRSPFEDFLTELLAEWLRHVTSSGRISEVLIELFKLNPSQLGNQENLNSIIWETQHVIGPGHHRAEGKRPDLIGRGSDFFLIIENKIAAGFTQHQDALGEIDQLSLYESYWQERSEPYGGLVLLTHFTLPPMNWPHGVTYWRDVEQYIRAFLGNSSTTSISTLDYFTKQLSLFLRENGMNGTRIALQDITAYPAYQRLTEGLYGLGCIAENQLKLAIQHIDMNQLKAPRGGSGGDFVWPAFFGWTLCDHGYTPHDAHFILWSGTISGEIYNHIKPTTAGIPDLSVGIGLWCKPISEEIQDWLDEQVKNLNSLSLTPWILRIHHREEHGPIILLYARRSLIDVHIQADGGDFDDIAGEFFKTHIIALLKVLNTQFTALEKNTAQHMLDLTPAGQTIT